VILNLSARFRPESGDSVEAIASTEAGSFHAREAMRRICVWLVAAMTSVFVPGRVMAEESVDARIQTLEKRIAHLDSSVRDNSSDGAALFLYGVFCALWAQNTGRNAWLWFFLGLLFSVITVLVLLYRNSEDLRKRRAWTEPPGG
jgi:hypothetical protein